MAILVANMFPRSIYIVMAGLVFFASQDGSTSTSSLSPIPSASLSQSATSQATSTKPTLSSTNFISQTSTPTGPTSTPTGPTSTPTGPPPTPIGPPPTPTGPTSTPITPTSTPITPTSTPITPTSSVVMTPPTTPPYSQNWTCLNLSMVIKQPWNSSYTGESSQEFQSRIKSEIKVLFKDTSKYGELELLGQLDLKEKDENIDLTVKLCIEVKKDDADSSVIDILITLNKTGNLEKWKVKEGSVTFEEIGVKLGDWKVHDSECSKCSDGGAGHFVMKRGCTSLKSQSCNGLKTKETKADCVKYCDSCAVAISSFTLIMGIILSFSFNIWK